MKVGGVSHREHHKGAVLGQKQGKPIRHSEGRREPASAPKTPPVALTEEPIPLRRNFKLVGNYP